MSRPFRDRVALNPLQWATPRVDPTDPHSPRRWMLGDPSYRDRYPETLRQVRAAGFDAVMLEVLATQTLQDYARLITDAELRVAPGYAAIDVPDDLPARGTAERVRLFDAVRRKAEESAYFGLETIFLSPAMSWDPTAVRTTTAAAVGAAFDADRLDRLTEVIAEAADVLHSEGVRAGLHNHVGTWIETVEELEQVFSAVHPSRLGASLDIGHLAWTGVDPAAVLRAHHDRLIDLHVKDIDSELARRSRDSPHPYSWAPRQGLFREPGSGDLDLGAVLDALPAGFAGWIVIEVDSTDLDPFDSARRCAQWADAEFPVRG